MAKEANQDAKKTDTDAAEEQTKGAGKKPLLRRLLSAKSLAILLGVSLIIHGMGFAYYKWSSKASADSVGSEVALGTFRFEADKSEDGRIAAAEFSVYIALLDKVDQGVRPRLGAYRFRIQQDIEELLRQAHSGDFDDPNLGELKRQLQEQVNETIGVRAISDVIITNLEVEHRESNVSAVANSDKTVPWIEKPSE